MAHARIINTNKCTRTAVHRCRSTLGLHSTETKIPIKKKKKGRNQTPTLSAHNSSDGQCCPASTSLAMRCDSLKSTAWLARPPHVSFQFHRHQTDNRPYGKNTDLFVRINTQVQGNKKQPMPKLQQRRPSYGRPLRVRVSHRSTAYTRALRVIFYVQQSVYLVLYINTGWGTCSVKLTWCISIISA